MRSNKTTNGLRKQLENWNQINWSQVNKAVRNLRQRIFRARKLGNLRKLRSLQKLMHHSYANLLLSVRRITQTNLGKATAGIDREIVNTPSARVILVNNWNGGNLKPTRRVEIPKPNGKKRPRLYPNRARQNRSGNSKECTGTRMGSLVRTQLLWVSTWQKLSGCYRTMFYKDKRR